MCEKIIIDWKYSIEFFSVWDSFFDSFRYVYISSFSRFLVSLTIQITRDTGGEFRQCFMCSFYARRSRKPKKIQLSHQYLFKLSGSVFVKAVHRMLMKLTMEKGEKQKKVKVKNHVWEQNRLGFKRNFFF